MPLLLTFKRQTMGPSISSGRLCGGPEDAHSCPPQRQTVCADGLECFVLSYMQLEVPGACRKALDDRWSAPSCIDHCGPETHHPLLVLIFLFLPRLCINFILLRTVFRLFGTMEFSCWLLVLKYSLLQLTSPFCFDWLPIGGG